MTADNVFQKTWGFLTRKAGAGFEVAVMTSQVPAHLQTLSREKFASATRKSVLSVQRDFWSSIRMRKWRNYPVLSPAYGIEVDLLFSKFYRVRRWV